MDVEEFTKSLASKNKQLDYLMRRTLPVKVGNMAKAHYQENFRQGGFVNGGLHKWPDARRRSSGSKAAAAKYGTLLSSRNHMYNSMKYTPADYRVKVANDVSYAPLHNWGGNTHPKVTPKMRKFAWAMYYKTAGIRKSAAKGKRKGKRKKRNIPPEAERWKGLALTKKKTLNIKIPQRQFLGESRELSEKVNDKIETEIRNIIFK